MLATQWGSLFAAGLLCWVASFTAPLTTNQPAGSHRSEAAQYTSTNSENDGSPAARHSRGSVRRLRSLLRRYGYWAVGAATLAEGTGIPMPGQTLLIIGGVEAAEGRMNIAWLLLFVTAAATLGNSLGYALGYWGGRFVLNKLKVNLQRQQYLDELFKRRGGFVILFGRFVDGLRQLNGILSGTMKMPWWSFSAYNVAGALLWTGAWGIGSYYLGRRIHGIAGFFSHHHALLYLLVSMALLALLAYLLHSTRSNGPTR